ncbi:trans-aconitate 2-methyltransferase [Actinomycetospora termitidis]|uniref:Trans-aconitate 2-methyltransferase n=1 Tax=Actinomycetospora termitidis TaxID=3053470 RepID=A0ABT7M6P9_9PSEU|nr:trans-aconitate 2-methyltransferase [Actinomycetospora sp. Odt1-22]MDL5156334.1 trans-aconitate 2-methyltransferase [Actinomycetospora sp. Odt1-22]
MSTTWDPALYLDFDDLRSRPFLDLLARVRASAPRHVVDAGCGPGHLTQVLGQRWPDARVTAFDSSAEMVAAARELGIDAVQESVTDWRPEGDVVVTNAVLQWVPGHRALLRRWLQALPDGGWLAMQVPGNFTAPSHELAREVADRFDVDLRDAATVAEPAAYADDLAGASSVDVWETTYLQRLTGEDPVLHWISGTALRPVRDALSDAAYRDFTADLAPRLREAYPANADGSTWFPFRRIFAVARR